MQTPPHSHADNVIDLQATLDRLGGDADILNELAAYFREDAGQLVDNARQAASANDHREVERSAHSLKGLAANFEARHLVSAAWRLEEAGRHQQSDRYTELIEQMQTRVREVLDTLFDQLAQ